MALSEPKVRLTYPQLYMMVSLITYFLAIFAGTLEGDAIYSDDNLEVTEYTILWGAFLGAAMLTFFMAFRLSWKNATWFAGAYIFQLGGVTLYLLADEPGSMEFAISAFLVFISYALLSTLVWKIKDIRDSLQEDSRIVMEYVPLGLWAIEIVVAGTFLLASLISFQIWVDEGGSLVFFLLYQVIFYGVVLHAFVLPEELFYTLEKNVPEEMRRSLIEKRRTPDDRKRTVRETGAESCPLCGQELNREKRKCGSCGEVFEFRWCGNSEEYIITCPYCNLQTPYGREKCIHCERAIQTSIRCPSCSTEVPLSEWHEA